MKKVKICLFINFPETESWLRGIFLIFCTNITFVKSIQEADLVVFDKYQTIKKNHQEKTYIFLSFSKKKLAKNCFTFSTFEFFYIIEKINEVKNKINQ